MAHSAPSGTGAFGQGLLMVMLIPFTLFTAVVTYGPGFVAHCYVLARSTKQPEP